MNDAAENTRGQRARLLWVGGVIGCAAVALVWRAVSLNVVDREFLQDQGDARYLRVVPVAAHRGMISDRNGEPLAISTPVESVWANPQVLALARDRWTKLARALDVRPDHLARLLVDRQGREFVYLKRQVTPDMAARVMALQTPGVALMQEYRRYYPAGEVAAHVVGFTNIDDAGQEGFELAMDDTLRGVPGSKRVIKDLFGRVVEDVESVREPRPGQDITLSIDRRVQYLAYRELKAAVARNRAVSGSAVVLDVQTGEVLAMVNQPSYNPNSRDGLDRSSLRNRAVTDLFEPGSTVKPFTVAAALETGKVRPDTIIDTRPGLVKVGSKVIRDFKDYGVIDVTTLLQKSSNVGASKLALAMTPEHLWKTFSGVGFGVATGSGFPGEAGGVLPDYAGWNMIERATLSFGYGLSVTNLQLARAYAVLAGDGRLRPVTFARGAAVAEALMSGEPPIPQSVLRDLRKMLETVVLDGGTGTQAAVAGYRVAGKTGTSKKSGVGGYVEDSYVSVFAGMAPATAPRLVMVVTVNDPRGEEYYGGAVAAPVFGKVMAGALRMLDIPPDALPASPKGHVALLDARR